MATVGKIKIPIDQFDMRKIKCGQVAFGFQISVAMICSAGVGQRWIGTRRWMMNVGLERPSRSEGLLHCWAIAGMRSPFSAILWRWLARCWTGPKENAVSKAKKRINEGGKWRNDGRAEKSEWKQATRRMWWKEGEKWRRSNKGEELIVMSFVC